MRKATKRKHAFWAALIAGLLMIASGSVGSTSLWRLGYTLLAAWFPFFEPLLFTALILVLILASFGGLTVLAGAYYIHEGRTRTPQFLITIGVGAGLLGLAFHLLLVFVEGGNPVRSLVATGTTVAGLAVLLSIYARAML